MNCNIPEVHEHHPEWFNVNRKGESSWDKPAYIGSYRFLCPSRSGVHEFLKRRISELARFDQLDGIYLDVIRQQDAILARGLQPKYGIVQHRECPEYDYCYCEACRGDFEKMHGADPLEMEDPTTSQEWLQFRYDLITRIVNEMLVPIGRARGKAMTAAVFSNWQHVRQQWSRWDLDGVHPMLYQSFYLEDVAWIGEQTRAGIASLERDVPLYPWLMVSSLEPKAFKEAVRVTLDAGASGVALYSSQTMREEQWEILRAMTID